MNIIRNITYISAVIPLLLLSMPVSSFGLMGGAVQGEDLHLMPGNLSITTLAGGTTGSADGTGSAAAFNKLNGATTDGTNLYVADLDNHTIRKIVIATGVVTTLAGSPGNSGSADGTGSNARFNWPTDVTTDGTNLYVADGRNSTIRKIVIATGVVTTLAGLAGEPSGSVDGVGSAARFASPCGITTDGANLYIADTYSHVIRKIVIASRTVTTLAGSAYKSGTGDGTGAAARFNTPFSITTDGTNLYVSDSGNRTIRKIVIATGVVTTLAGSAGTTPDLLDGTGTAARFYNPAYITMDGPNLYVVESDKKTIRKIVIATGVVTSLTAPAGVLWWPVGVTTDGTNLYVTDINCIHTISVATADTIPPTVTGVTASSPTNSLSIPVTITASDNTGGSGVTAYLVTASSAIPAATASGWSSSNLFVYTVTSNGTYTLYGWAKDAFGNVSQNQTATVTVTVNTSTDTIPPTVTGVTASSPTNSLSIPVTITASDNTGGSGIVAYLVTASSAIPAATASGWSSSNPFVYTVTSNGTYTLYGWAKDAFGNVSQNQTATVTVTVDTAGPPSIGLMGGAIQGKDLHLMPGNVSMTTLAGGNTGSADGTGSAAAFNKLNGATTDGTNLYVADMDNHTIRKIVIATGVVTTLAGSPGNSGSADGTGSNARFNWPTDVTTDGTNLYVADGRNNTIRKIVIATGVVTTLAGSATGMAGSVDGVGAAALFASPCGVTTDGTNLYIADTYSHTIRKIVIASQTVTTLAGSAGAPGSVDGVGSAARFNTPLSITTDGTNLYINDSVNKTIRKIVIATGTVTTLAGSAGTTPDLLDGTGTAARFYNPAYITMDGPNLYVVESDKKTIRKIVMATGVVTTLTGSAVVLWWPVGVTTDGTNLYVTDVNCIRTISVTNADTTPPTVTGVTASSPTNRLSIPVTISASDNAGGSGVAAYLVTASPAIPAATASGWGSSSTIIYTVTTSGTYTLYGWAKDAFGNVSQNQTATTVTVDTTGPPPFGLMGGAVQGRDLHLAAGNVSMTTLAGGTTGSADGTGPAAAFNKLNGATTDGTNLYVADMDNHTIRKVVIATGVVTTLAGSAGNSGSADGTGSNARFNWPTDVTTDGTNLYVADGRNNTIRKIVIATGVVTTLAGSATGMAGSVDGVGAAALFASPCGVTTDGTNLYIADTYSHTIRKIVIASQMVTTLAGSAYSNGTGDGTGAAARFNTPLSITTDGTNLYVSDSGNKTIRKIVIATGVVTTLAGSAGTTPDLLDGTGAAARFYSPAGITTDGTNLYVAESDRKTIRKIVIATGVVTSLTGSAVVLWWPVGVTTDGTNLYVTDVNCIRTIRVATADTTPPTVTGVTASSPTKSLSIPVTISASDNTGGSGIVAYLVTASSAIPAATASGWSSSNPFVYTVATPGTYTLYGWAKDAFGNVSLNQTATVTVIVNIAGPTIVISSPSVSSTRNGPVTYTVTYGDADNVALANIHITLNKTGTANGTVAVTGTGNSTRTVTISSITGDGSLGISIVAGTASDDDGNPSPAAGPSVTFTVFYTGDVNNDGLINLADVIMALKVLSGMTPAGMTYTGTDINSDGKIGLAEVFYILQKTAGVR